jgi:hypothetical protein
VLSGKEKENDFPPDERSDVEGNTLSLPRISCIIVHGISNLQRTICIQYSEYVSITTSYYRK